MVAQTTSDNDRMLALFAKRGFAITPEDGGVVWVSRPLAVGTPSGQLLRLVLA